MSANELAVSRVCNHNTASCCLLLPQLRQAKPRREVTCKIHTCCKACTSVEGMLIRMAHWLVVNHMKAWDKLKEALQHLGYARSRTSADIESVPPMVSGTQMNGFLMACSARYEASGTCVQPMG